MVDRLVLFAVALALIAAPARAADLTSADLLALEISGEVVAPPDMVDRIAADLAKIRAADPDVAKIEARPQWEPGSLFVRLTDEALERYLAGEYHDLDELNAAWGLDRVSRFGNWLFLEFEKPYNPVALGEFYVAVESVESSEVNGISGDGDDILATEVGTYTFRHAWGDCPAGCISEHLWEFTVTGGTPVLVREYGDSVPIGADSVTDIKSRYSTSP
jgi:hypothetical protein